MKTLIRNLFLIGLPVVFIFHVGFGVFFSHLYGKAEINFNEIMLKALIFSITFITIFTLGIRAVISPKIKFLNSNSPIENKFGNTLTVINIKTPELDFMKIRQRVNKYFIVTYVDENESIIKFREKFGLFSWGAAAVLKFEKEYDRILIYAFPLNLTGNKIADRLVQKVKIEVIGPYASSGAMLE